MIAMATVYCVLMIHHHGKMKQRMPFCCTVPADFVTKKQDFIDLLPCPITGIPTLTVVKSYLILIPAPLDSVFNEFPCSAVALQRNRNLSKSKRTER